MRAAPILHQRRHAGVSVSGVDTVKTTTQSCMRVLAKVPKQLGALRKSAKGKTQGNGTPPDVVQCMEISSHRPACEECTSQTNGPLCEEGFSGEGHSEPRDPSLPSFVFLKQVVET